MNAAERSLFYIAVALFAVGLVVRYLPWGLPAIDTFDVGEAATRTVVQGADRFSAQAAPEASRITDKLTYDADGGVVDREFGKKEGPPGKKQKKRKSGKKIVKLPIHINQASLDEICALKGVGPKMAERIIAVREASGPFKNASDLQKVPGIGKKKAETMLQGIIFD